MLMQEDCSLSTIRTIGYGSRSLPDLISELAAHDISYVIDVRSSPRSRFKPEFDQQNLKSALTASSITYVYMGKELGGIPGDVSMYTNGHADYERMAQGTPFQSALERLRVIHRKGIRAVLLCSEGSPERCHRSKLIGVELSRSGIEIGHIDADGKIVSQEVVVHRVRGSQLAFENLAPPLRSRGRYIAEQSNNEFEYAPISQSGDNLER
jgi:uncharacterized protein (DUF488 family)